MSRFTKTILQSYIDANDCLDLNDKSLKDEDIVDIVTFINSYPNIKTVDMRGNYIGDKGAEYFAKHNEVATEINFNTNQIGDAGAKDFAEHNTTVTWVDLSKNKIGPKGAKDFAEHNTTVTWVDLSYNQIGDEGAKDFAEHNTTVTTVNLSYNNIGPQGITSFAEHNKVVTRLNLSNNNTGDKGAKGFAEHNKIVTEVDLQWNQISSSGAKFLISNQVIQKFVGYYHDAPAVYPILSEKNPWVRAKLARKKGLQTTPPSLLSMCLFAVKKLSEETKSNEDNVFSTVEQGEFGEDLAERIKQFK